MIVAGSASPLLLASAGGYNLTRSLRFRSSASAYLNRTPSSTGNNQKFTWSGWVKRGTLGAEAKLFGAATGTSNTWYCMFGDGVTDTITFGYFNGTSVVVVRTSAVYRDPSAWYHIVVAIDTTQATAANRVLIYVNGIQVTAFSTATYPTLNQTTHFNTSGTPSYLGITTSSTSSSFDGYMAEVNFIDGQALTPSSFGANNASTGVWQPKKYAGTYGTNGFYLPFSNNASTTTLGNDFSGNGNNWTTNNISLTAGSTYDSMTDVPTLTSATAANYCVMNPNYIRSLKPTISFANLRVTTSSAGDSYFAGTMATGSSGKYYYEMTYTSASNGILYGATDNENSGSANSGTYRSNTGVIYNLDGTTATTGATYTTGDVIGVAVNIDTGSVTFYKNNASQGSFSFTAGTSLIPYGRTNGTGSETADFNFGQRPFSYTPPTGFVALNTFNLPTPTIGATASTQANKYFDVLTWTGNGTTNTTFSQTGLGFSPDFVWAKKRSSGTSHLLYDVLRGPSTAIASKALSSDFTGAEGSQNDNIVNDYLSSFNSNGFSYYSGSSPAYFNTNGGTYVGWCWDAGGTGVSNTDGTITSTVSANTSAGFSVVTYTGNGSGGATIGHGLGIAPSMVIVKRRDAIDDWSCYHVSLGGTKYIDLNRTDAAGTSIVLWNNTNPSSTVVTLGTSNRINGSSATYVAYCFSEVAGYSKIDSYTGNGSADGTFVYTGFRPRFVMIKRTNSAEDWLIYDTSRNPFNLTTLYLKPNSSDAEVTGISQVLDVLSNGIKLRASGDGTNASGSTYVYMAFAESPFKYANAR